MQLGQGRSLQGPGLAGPWRREWGIYERFGRATSVQTRMLGGDAVQTRAPALGGAHTGCCCLSPCASGNRMSVMDETLIKVMRHL